MSLQTPGQLSNKTFLIVSITLTCVASLFVVARLIASWQRKPKRHVDRIDDYIALAALLVLAATVAGYNELILALSSPQTKLASLMRLSNALTWLGALMLWGCKVPILVLYITLFNVKTWLRISSYAIIAVTATIFIIMASFVTAKCTGPLDEGLLWRCQPASTKAGFTLGLVSIITDALIFVLPISVIVRLQLPLKKRIGVSIIFAGGLVAIAASAVSTSYKWKSLKWSASGGTNDMICTVVECAVAIMVACIPAGYGLWSRNIATSGLYSRVSSAFSHLFLVRSRRSRSGACDTSVRSQKSHASTGSTKLVHIHQTGQDKSGLSEEEV
ncbi:uncharacterized protein K460DRAFT_325942 [Cucurbitaria berberidis CBS 394.84]|uniref:Rhodopsin domain-containing protein n=1 Tax=Cucurbitaria berberidis CBS 394.84 TaxID=1168544 RepID=A0A9P4LDS2_9PLEO|nr:uncharacterized protein K460DRAFT_325942 [Cucurbitaria berberidis CBS 394.84]KAF1852231.1 hypothetical protein K460DRAFT_325942 [Cucurbitaria berberidis CBS 394.84]